MFRDGAFIAGALTVLVGLWLIYPPLAMIVAGGSVVVYCLGAAK